MGHARCRMLESLVFVKKKYCSSKESVTLVRRGPGDDGWPTNIIGPRVFLFRGPSTLGQECWDGVSISGLKYDSCKGARDVKVV